MGAYDYYGKMNNGQSGWNTDLSAFAPGGITDVNQGGMLGSNFYNGTDGVANNAGSSVNGIANGSLGGGSMGGMMDSTKVGPNGGQTTTQGWGGMALGLGQMYMGYTQGKEQQKFAREQLDFSKEQFYKNYAMQMDQYRRKVNKGSNELAWSQGDRSGSLSQSMIDGGYNDGSRMVDANGNTVADPTYGHVAAAPATASASAFAPTIAGINPQTNALLANGTGIESVGTDVESKRRSRPASQKTSNDQADDAKGEAVEASTETKKKKLT